MGVGGGEQFEGGGGGGEFKKNKKAVRGVLINKEVEKRKKIANIIKINIT